MPALKNLEIIRILKRHKFQEIGRSRHGIEFWRRDEAGKDYLVRVPNHPSQTCSPGTLASIIENSGLTREEFFKKKHQK